jgi:hypothetical protein
VKKLLKVPQGKKLKGFVGVTDNDWFAFLSQEQGIDKVNFCKLTEPGA